MTVLHYLEGTAKKNARKTALVDNGGSITFGEICNAAYKIAGYLRAQFAKQRRNPILVYLPKSKECIISFFGIAYSGNFYTPVDVNFPFAKAKSVIDALNPALIITDTNSAEKLRENGIPSNLIALYNDILVAGHSIDPEEALSQIIDTDPLYVFFTSGSTGVPKGVIVCHRSVRDYIDFLVSKFGFDENMKMANQAPFYFDNSILDIYTCVATGAELHIVPETYFSFPAKLMQYIAANAINFIFWVPSALTLLANVKILESVNCSCVTKVFFCGEVMPNKQLNYWRKHLPGVLYVNLYGPTEITDACTYFVVERDFADNEPLPIGFACDNTDILLLDTEDKLITGPDVMGELCVRGSSLALGYWNNPQRTAEVFVQNPLNPYYEEKIYRTGDLAHYNERGEIMFDGRKDLQIKHMGNRIELGEIETAATSLEGIQVACAHYDNNAGRIVLFYVGSLEEKELRRGLAEKLPRYMLPSIAKKLDEMPLNDNGKIDRQTLKNMHQ